ncbi:hypothetical protein FQZ97_840410 [compost metagenome]
MVLSLAKPAPVAARALPNSWAIRSGVFSAPAAKRPATPLKMLVSEPYSSAALAPPTSSAVSGESMPSRASSIWVSPLLWAYIDRNAPALAPFTNGEAANP